MRLSGNAILITGGGSGIGADLARRLADAGNRIIIAGRNQERLLAVAEGRPSIATLQLDLNDSAAISQAASQLIVDYPDLNVLINSAGVALPEDLTADTVDTSASELTIKTNLLGSILLISSMLPHLRTRAYSAIINVTSGLAFVPLCYTPAYSASKAALHSYTISLREQLANSSVEVVEIVPPAVKTDMSVGLESPFGSMLLSEFTEEVLSLLRQNPTPNEILVDAVKRFRFAERDGRLEEILRVFRSA